ncbi:MAG: tripartite tricarboxylate transporter substrate binding protein [Sphaerochaetaceae bacterium]
MKKLSLYVLVLFLSSAMFAQGASEPAASQAESWPAKSINLIVPWNPGDGTDLAARAYAQAVQDVTGQPVVVINKPGASGSIGTLYASQQSKDGYSVLFSAETPGTFQIMGISNIGFGAFDGIMMMAEDTKVIVVKGDSPYKTIQDLIDAIKANPGKIKMAYSGPGASGHIQGLLFKAMGLETSMTPFGGGAAGMTAVMGGQVDFTFANTATTLGYIKSGDLRPLAVFTDKENKALPGVPAFTDVMPESKKYLPLGFPYSVLVPKGTDPEIVRQIIAVSQKAVQDKAWLDFLSTRASYVTLYQYTGDEVNAYWTKWQSLVDYLLYDAGVAKYSPEKFGIQRLK